MLFAVIVACGIAAPTASAQYPPSSTTTQPPTTTTTEPPTTTTTERPTTTTIPGATTTTTAPPPPTIKATVSDTSPAPGDAITISTGPVDGGPALDLTEPVTGGLASGTGAGTLNESIAIRVIVEKDQSAVQRFTVEIPEGTAEGLYYLFIVGTDFEGHARVIVVPIVVQGAPDGAVDGAIDGETTPPASQSVLVDEPRRIATPPVVGTLQRSMSAAQEERVVEAVLEEDATVAIEDDRLILLPATGSDTARPLVASVSVLVVGGGLLLLRRKPTGTVA